MKNIVILITVLLLTSFTVMAQHKHATKIPADVEKILRQYACLACHTADTKLIGPAYLNVSKKKYSNSQIVELIYNPKPSNWPGFPPMAPMKQVPKEDALKIASWINSLAKKHV